jgi:hypothetical protein
MSKAKTADIAALLAANVRKRPGTKCAVCHALGTFDQATRDAIEAAMGDTERFAAIGLVGVLAELGHHVGRSTVERHRKRECVGSRGNA